MAKAGHTQKAYQGIRKLLFHNELAPGQKITIRDLVERLDMSQTPVIQALKWLEFQRLVRHEPNRGYFLEPISPQEVAEVYELRELIELSLLPKILDRLDPGAMKELGAALEGHLEAAREIYLFERLTKDMEFHLTLARLSGCKVQLNTLRNLFDVLYLKYGGNILFATSMDSADTDHKALFKALADNDLVTSRNVLSGHIQRVREHVLNGLEKMQLAKQQSSI
jgi:DNA-binding GntR family transcriptional regulator